MDLAQYRIKLRRNRDGSSRLHQYALTYKRVKGHINQAGYDIVSALAGDSDLIVEFSTDLFYGVGTDPGKCAEKFLNDIQSMNLEHISRKVPSQLPVVILGINMGKKEKLQAHEIAAYVPNRVWKSPSFRDVLPVCGARFYIAGEPADARKALDNLFDLSEEQKAAAFRMILFHMAEYERFGIMSASDMEKELRGMLGL